MPNRLIQETSPYLLQHAHNPVDWYAWGEEALERARKEDKPILLSIGYSACHWCHVMEHESFENPDIAKLMNDNFINIKVDREERPDLDQIYMSAVQIMTGQRRLAADGVPAAQRRALLRRNLLSAGRPLRPPGFPRLLANIAEAYRNRRKDIEDNAQNAPAASQSAHADRARRFRIDRRRDSGRSSRSARVSRFDPREGGFGGAPKFPPSMSIDFLLRYHHRTGDAHALHMATFTLDKMAYGGMYDQVGGGFHRYSTDDRWLVPHFEKMLYDNALLARAYLDAYRLTRQAAVPAGSPKKPSISSSARCATRTAASTPRRTPTAKASKASSTSGTATNSKASSETTANCSRATSTSPSTATGNTTIFSTSRGRRNCSANSKRFRKQNWNRKSRRRARSCMRRAKSAFTRAATKKSSRTGTACCCAPSPTRRPSSDATTTEALPKPMPTFLFDKLWDGERLLHSFKDGRARFNAYLDDYANVADGLLALYQLTFDEHWLRRAESLAEIIVDRFGDDDREASTSPPADHEELIARTKDFFDNATPSGNSVAADVLLRLAALLGRDDFRKAGRAGLRRSGESSGRIRLRIRTDAGRCGFRDRPFIWKSRLLEERASSSPRIGSTICRER